MVYSNRIQALAAELKIESERLNVGVITMQFFLVIIITTTIPGLLQQLGQSTCHGPAMATPQRSSCRISNNGVVIRINPAIIIRSRQ